MDAQLSRRDKRLRLRANLTSWELLPFLDEASRFNRQAVSMARLREYYSVEDTNWPDTRPPGEINEEWEDVRQWLLSELVNTYQYPAEWLRDKIQLASYEKETLGIELKTEDGCCFTVCVIGPSDEAKRELRRILLEKPYAGNGISTDGTEEGTSFLRRRFDSDEVEHITDIEEYTAAGDKAPLFSSQDEHKLSFRPLSDSAERVFLQAHNQIRDIDGRHADEALDELCKVLYAKVYDEENSDSPEDRRIHSDLYGTSEAFAATIRKVFEEASEYDKRVFGNRIEGYRRSRGVFDEEIRLSSVALAKVAEEIEAYSLLDSDTDIKGRAFQEMLTPAVRAGMGQYFTPDPVVDFMVRVARPHPNDLILDPFCGSGRFLSVSLSYVRENSDESKTVHDFAITKLHGIEKSERMVRVAMTDMRLQGDGHSNIRCTDSLLAFRNYPDMEPESFDIILTNPPFGSSLNPEAINGLGQFELAKESSSTSLEVLGLERCCQLLRPGGKLGIVFPDGELANITSSNIRHWIQRNFKVRAIVSLPVDTFTPFGANLGTSILFLRKWKEDEDRDEDYDLFLAKTDDVGYDSTMRETGNNELPKISEDINSFIDKKGW